MRKHTAASSSGGAFFFATGVGDGGEGVAEDTVAEAAAGDIFSVIAFVVEDGGVLVVEGREGWVLGDRGGWVVGDREDWVVGVGADEVDMPINMSTL